ncbi:caspase family protein [Haladaptatus cibarius]|uniref:caspase family protein n=1 Tax=Haladaptatus cibarius TaxID=453847 RepID=UPI000679926E|nr:caspase family protein [Haladaptatus cibarius]
MSEVSVTDVAGEGVTPQFRLRDDLPGLTVIDPLERNQFQIETSRPVEPRAVPVSAFHAPVGVVTSITTARIRFSALLGAYIRTTDNELVCAVDHETNATLPNAEYYIELTTPVKTYLRVESAIDIDTSNERLDLSFGGETTVEIGSRSRHTHPGGTVTTTTDPKDVMAAVSSFGSALKTTSPERSFPTLRGHPPAVEFGDELHVPDELQPPETGIRIEVPPKFEFIFPIAPLSYYLGATVVPGEHPRIVTKSTTIPLDHPERGFEGEIERVLKQTFFLDCVTRTEGLYRIDLHEREQIEPLVDLDFSVLYDMPIAERLEAYLDVPFATLSGLLPTWRLAIHVTAEPENSTHLPYVIRDIPLVRMANGIRENDDTVETVGSIRDFARTVESDTNRPVGRAPTERYVTPPNIDTTERAWLGEGAPVGGNKLLPKGFEHRLDKEHSTEDISIAIVCNDPKMQAEYEDDLYGNREELPFDVQTYRNCSTAELHELLRSRTDFFHYIGHVEDGSFVCSDGTLDPSDIPHVGVDMFLLNACRSYVPGKRLIEAGSIGGIVTYSEVGNAGATVVGRTVGRLLNTGFPLRSALSIAREQRLVGNQYVVVGDGGIEIVQADSGVPLIHFVESLDDGRYRVRSRSHPANGRSMGGTILPFIDGVQTHFLSGGDIPTVTLTADELRAYFGLEEAPVVYDGTLRWTSEIDVARDFS